MGGPSQCPGPRDRDAPLDLGEFRLSSSPGMMHALGKSNILKHRLRQAASSGFSSPSPPAPGVIFPLSCFSFPAGPT